MPRYFVTCMLENMEFQSLGPFGFAETMEEARALGERSHRNGKWGYQIFDMENQGERVDGGDYESEGEQPDAVVAVGEQPVTEEREDIEDRCERRRKTLEAFQGLERRRETSYFTARVASLRFLKNALEDQLFDVAGVHGVEMGLDPRGRPCIRVLTDASGEDVRERVRSVLSDAVPFEVERADSPELQ